MAEAIDYPATPQSTGKCPAAVKYRLHSVNLNEDVFKSLLKSCNHESALFNELQIFEFYMHFRVLLVSS